MKSQTARASPQGRDSSLVSSKVLRRRTRADASINAFNNCLLHRAERANIADAIPGIGSAGWATDGFVAFEEAGHEKFVGERGEFNATPLAVRNDLIRLTGINHAQDGAGLR